MFEGGVGLGSAGFAPFTPKGDAGAGVAVAPNGFVLPLVVAGGACDGEAGVLPKTGPPKGEPAPKTEEEAPKTFGAATRFENAFFTGIVGAPFEAPKGEVPAGGPNKDVLGADQGTGAGCSIAVGDSDTGENSPSSRSSSPSSSSTCADEDSTPSMTSGIDRSPRISSRLSCTEPLPNNRSSMHATK